MCPRRDSGSVQRSDYGRPAASTADSPVQLQSWDSDNPCVGPPIGGGAGSRSTTGRTSRPRVMLENDATTSTAGHQRPRGFGDRVRRHVAALPARRLRRLPASPGSGAPSGSGGNAGQVSFGPAVAGGETGVGGRPGSVPRGAVRRPELDRRSFMMTNRVANNLGVTDSTTAVVGAGRGRLLDILQRRPEVQANAAVRPGDYPTCVSPTNRISSGRAISGSYPYSGNPTGIPADCLS